MKAIDLSAPAASSGSPARLARLVRHLEARLADLGPGGPQAISACQQTGLVLARFPGHSPQSLADTLKENFGIQVRSEGDFVAFQLTPDLSFEDLDYVWGSLFQLVSQ